MTRLLALTILALLIYFAIGHFARAMRRSLVGRQIEALWGSIRQDAGHDRERTGSVELVRCRSCGVHVPRASARTGPSGHLCQRCGGRTRTA